MSQSHTANSTSPRTGASRGEHWFGCCWDILSLTVSSSKDIIRGVNIPAGFQWCFPSCHLVDKGDIFQLFNTQKREHLGK